jgi:broad-specificity NMP kinase
LSKKGIIVIGGCPATGKSVVGKILAEMLSLEYIDYADYLLKMKAAKIINNEIVIEEAKAKRILKEKDEAVISGVYAFDYLDVSKVKSVYVLRCNPKILFYRYLQRDYNLEKIKNNITSEYLDICLKMALKKMGYEKVNQLDVSNDEPHYTALRIYYSLKNGYMIFDRVDWLSQVSRPFDMLLMK